MTKVKLGTNSRVKVKWNVLPIDYSEAGVNDIIAKMSKKYNIPKSHITVEPIMIKNGVSDDGYGFAMSESESIQDPQYQQSLFEPYLKERNVTDYDIQSLFEIDDTINSSIDYERYDKHKKYTIKWIKWSNFMSYGPDNFFDFTNLNGLVMLSSVPANQGGKSTFCLDLLRFLLFGKVTSREDGWTLSKLFNRHLPEATEVVVEGCISIDSTDYVIKRVVSRPQLKNRTEKSKVSQKINYYKVLNGNYIDLIDEDGESENGSTATETNKLIKEAIGNERDFDLMICVDQDNLKGLISLKDTERGRLITRWVGLLPLEEKDKIARETFNKSVSPKLLTNKYNKESLLQDNDEIKHAIKNNEDSIADNEKKIEYHNGRLKKEKDYKDALLQSKRTVDNTLVNADINSINNQNDALKNKGIILKNSNEENRKRYDEIKDVKFDESEYNALIKKDKEKGIELSELRNECNNLKNEIKALKEGEFCPTCGAKLKNVDNSKLIEEKSNRYNEAIEEGKKAKLESEKIEESINSIANDRKLYEEKSKLELLIEKNEVDMENLRSKIRENNRILKDVEANKEAIAKNNEIDASIRTANASISTIEGEINRINIEIGTLKMGNENYKKKIEDNCKIIVQLEEDEKTERNWKIYLDIVGKNGISKMVLRKALPLINCELKRLLDDVCDFTVEVGIDDKNDVSFYMIHDGVRSNLGSGSGFEKTAASLALRSVLSKISTFSKPSFVVFDEVLGGVSDENYDQIKKLYDKIAVDYKFILHISHLKQIYEWHTCNIVVTKENNISKIVKNID